MFGPILACLFSIHAAYVKNSVLRFITVCGEKTQIFYYTWSSLSRMGGACVSMPPPPWPVGRAGLWTGEQGPKGRPPAMGGCWPLTARAEVLTGGLRGP